MLLLWAVTALLGAGGLREDTGKLHMQLTCSGFKPEPLGFSEAKEKVQVLTLNFAFMA